MFKGDAAVSQICHRDGRVGAELVVDSQPPEVLRLGESALHDPPPPRGRESPARQLGPHCDLKSCANPLHHPVGEASPAPRRPAARTAARTPPRPPACGNSGGRSARGRIQRGATSIARPCAACGRGPGVSPWRSFSASFFCRLLFFHNSEYRVRLVGRTVFHNFNCLSILKL